jgi:hypothetical protein
MSIHLMLGIAKIDITPYKPIDLAGFTQRKGTFTGISHGLDARIFYFCQEVNGMKRSAIMVAADLIWWGNELVAQLRVLVHEKYGVNENEVILHATHTHSGPQTSSRFTPSLGLPDSEYIQYLSDKIIDGIDLAIENLEPVMIKKGTGECRIGIHRRKLVNGHIKMAPNESGPIDPEVSVIQYCKLSGKTKALMVHYTCHPTTTMDNLVSSEFPGVAMKHVEATLGEDVVAAYLQGCCGDIRPNLVRSGQFYRGFDSEVRELGLSLASEVLAVLDKPMQILTDCPLEGTTMIVELPFQPLPTWEELRSNMDRADLFAEWSQLFLNDPERLKTSIPFEINLLKIANGLSFLSMNGEVVVEYGLFVKKMGIDDMLPLAYTNGMIGYIPTGNQVAEGGYEVDESCYYFGLPAQFDPSLEKEIHERIMILIEEGKGNEYRIAK